MVKQGKGRGHNQSFPGNIEARFASEIETQLELPFLEQVFTCEVEKFNDQPLKYLDTCIVCRIQAMLEQLQWCMNLSQNNQGIRDS